MLRCLAFVLTSPTLLDWALPDQLVYSVVSSLLQLANYDSRFGESIIDAVLGFSATIVERIKYFGCMSILLPLPPLDGY